MVRQGGLWGLVSNPTSFLPPSKNHPMWCLQCVSGEGGSPGNRRKKQRKLKGIQRNIKTKRGKQKSERTTGKTNKKQGCGHQLRGTIRCAVGLFMRDLFFVLARLSKGGVPNCGGPEGWGPQTWKDGASKGGSRRVGPRRVGAQNFAFFFTSLPSSGSSRGILVVFFWASDAQMCTFGVLGQPHRTREKTKGKTFEFPGLPKHHQNSTRRPPEREKERKREAGVGTKRAKFWVVRQRTIRPKLKLVWFSFLPLPPLPSPFPTKGGLVHILLKNRGVWFNPPLVHFSCTPEPRVACCPIFVHFF